MRAARLAAVAGVVVLAVAIFSFGGSAEHTKRQLAPIQKPLEEATKAAAEKTASHKLAAEKAALEAERARLAAEKARQAAQAQVASAAAQPGGGAPKSSAFQTAQAFEGEGKGREAVKAYIQAARGGNCEAAKRLGEIYDKGLIGISRDYAESLKWYNAARVLGCEVPMAKSNGGGGSVSPSRSREAPEPIAASTAVIERFPTIESPDAVGPKDVFAVQVSLTLELLTPEVSVQPGAGTAMTPRGSISLSLPAGKRDWVLDVVLTAPGFSFLDGSNLGRITLPSEGDSSPAVFKLRPDARFNGPSKRTLYATLSHEGRYIGRLAKPILVSQDIEAAQPRQGLAQATKLRASASVNLDGERQTPDLTVVVLDASEAGKGSTEVIILSPHLQPRRESVVRSTDTESWILSQYQKILLAMQEAPAGKMDARTVPLLNGFGAQLFDGFAPPALRGAYAQLAKSLGDNFQSIQIITNNPALPWELMRPVDSNGKRADFLGVTHRVARWHLVSSGADLPPPVQRLALEEIVAIAPRYTGAEILGAQAREVNALRSLRHAQVVDGRLKTVSQLFQRRPAGIVHFAGHGEATKSAAGLFTYAIKLEDATLDVTSWRGLTDGPIGRGALVFFNACDVGQASRVARFVEGWAPAMLEAGASGYIGGLWPLSDTGAAEFAVRFYAGLMQRSGQGDVIVSDLLRQNRRAFREAGDPTFLAYVMYGDVNLRVGRLAR